MPKSDGDLINQQYQPRIERPTCMWPIGHPGDEGFRFCGAKPEPGKPYCQDHWTKAHIPLVKKKGETIDA